MCVCVYNVFKNTCARYVMCVVYMSVSARLVSKALCNVCSIHECERLTCDAKPMSLFVGICLWAYVVFVGICGCAKRFRQSAHTHMYLCMDKYTYIDIHRHT